ncbi:MAG: FtsX-like permease family protein [Ruminococcus sp.]|nr:FtsX-like permease family protein [Candidatus Copronaster equi]
MKSGFYLKTAWSNIKKNYRFYVPQILTGTGLLACLYIVFTLKSDGRIKSIPGGDYMPEFMSIGTAIISVLSVILIFYTNSFLMRQRKREYGLYNVLGMEKRHIGKIMFWENAISGGISVICGSAFGVLFYKICSLLICNIFKSDIIFGFDFLTLKTIIPPAVFFIAVYFFAFLLNRINTAKMKPVELLVSRQAGEKEPKVKKFILVTGFLSLLAGYAISVFVKSPIAAILLLFVAIFLVIIGTYFLFTAGSIFVLKALKKNKKYYYNKKHISSVSGLLYRMKQNAVGLASICILSTGVLIMISASVSLYSGMQETLDQNYPQDLYLTCFYTTQDGTNRNVSADVLKSAVENSAAQFNLPVKKAEKQKFLEVSYIFDGEKLMTKTESDLDISKLSNVLYITEDTYNELTGKKLNLNNDEVAISVTSTTLGTTIQPEKTITMHGKTYKTIKQQNFPIESNMAMITPSSYGIIVPNENVLNEIYLAQKKDYGKNASEMTDRVAVTFENREQACNIGEKLEDEIFVQLNNYVLQQPDHVDTGEKDCQSYWEAKEAVIGMYGTLLFLGIILGFVCLFATALIIYYKQISEGYEDRQRYQIMKKVGMSDTEIKKTISSQTLLVFFLPLVFAGVHTAFAFPIINRMLHLILLSSTSLFVICTLITFAIFAVIYIIIYSLTAKTYYKIVH